MGRPSKKPSLRKFAEVAEKCSGWKIPIAQSFGVDRTTVFRWCREDPAFEEAVKGARCIARESYIDNAERTIVKAVNDGDVTAAIFTLKTLGKNRGYTERNEVTGAGGKDLFPANEMTREEIMAEIERIRSIRNDK